MAKLLSSLLAVPFAALAQSTPVTHEPPKWFVLRDDRIAACWTALLVKIDGSYRHGFAMTAGGPYDTEEQALERQTTLREIGTCRP